MRKSIFFSGEEFLIFRMTTLKIPISETGFYSGGMYFGKIGWSLLMESVIDLFIFFIFGSDCKCCFSICFFYCMETSHKLYSQAAIALATFFGGPFAAALLIRKNCIALGQERWGFNALVLGIITTVLLFGSILMIPEAVLDKIPNALIPAIYTAIIYLIVEKVHGRELRVHKEKDGLFYSNWRAAGIGLVSCVVILTLFLGGIYLGEDNWNSTEYNAKVEQFARNEEEALSLYDILKEKPAEKAVEFIETTGIPKWKENIELLKAMDALEGIPSEFTAYNELLRNYCQVRIDMYTLIAKTIDEDSESYQEELHKLDKRLEDIMSRLSE